MGLTVNRKTAKKGNCHLHITESSYFSAADGGFKRRNVCPIKLQPA